MYNIGNKEKLIMEIKVKEELKVTLTLNKEEAKWLKEIMQNPLYNQTLEDEPEIDRSMRALFWDALHNKGIELTP